MDEIVAYYRVSTRKQELSGLGLDAQKATVADYARQHGAAIIKDFVEIESGKRTDARRPQLAQAMAFARRAGATLVVAKLDRLARNVHFTSGLMESGVDFVACDNPHANKFTIHILAAVAEHEAKQISDRTRAALAQAKARGVLLGSHRPGHWIGREQARLDGLAMGRSRASVVIKAKSRADYADLLPAIQAAHAAGQSLRQIADTLNAEGHRTRRGASFGPMQIRRILNREST